LKKAPVKIAVPTNDGENIFKGMLGRASNFYIYEINDKGDFRLLETRANPYEKTLQHLKTLDVYELIKDCSVVVAAKIGKNGIERLKERGVTLIIKEGHIVDNLEKLIQNKQFSYTSFAD